MDHGPANQTNEHKNSINIDEDLFDDSILEIFENSDFEETAEQTKHEKNNTLNKNALNVRWAILTLIISFKNIPLT